MTGLEFDKGTFGPVAVLRSVWTDEIAAAMRSRQCVELELNYAKGWKGEDLSFLSNLHWLQGLKITHWTIESVERIHQLPQLRELEVFTYCNTPLRFDSFPQLENCSLEWRSKAESVFDCLTLKKLFINLFKGKDLNSFKRLKSLESLALLGAPLETLKGIEPLTRLRSLRLGDLRKLFSLSGIEALHELEELEVHTCRRVNSIEPIAALPKLQKLFIPNNGEIGSLKPIDSIKNLRAVVFYESTNFLDGDLSPLLRQKHLTDVAFQNRRHYSHKSKEIQDLISKSNSP